MNEEKSNAAWLCFTADAKEGHQRPYRSRNAKASQVLPNVINHGSGDWFLDRCLGNKHRMDRILSVGGEDKDDQVP